MLPDDPSVALRHLLIRATSYGIRILDLHTDLGFVLPDGSKQTSVFVEGPIAMGVGEYALVALPRETREDALPDHLPPPDVRERMAAVEQGPYRANARPLNRVSRITLMPRIVMIGEPLPPRIGRLATGGRWSITLEREGRSATMGVSEEDLVGGVLIGRSEKCHAETLRRITDHNTSRVHVLILREDREVCAYDLASTHGVYHAGVAQRRVVLSPTGASLTLGRGDRAVRMIWRSAAIS